MVLLQTVSFLSHEEERGRRGEGSWGTDYSIKHFQTEEGKRIGREGGSRMNREVKGGREQ